MDPNQTYRDLQDAMHECDYETARALALDLKRWIARGGFYPTQGSPEAIDNCIADILRRRANQS